MLKVLPIFFLTKTLVLSKIFPYPQRDDLRGKISDIPFQGHSQKSKIICIELCPLFISFLKIFITCTSHQNNVYSEGFRHPDSRSRS